MINLKKINSKIYKLLFFRKYISDLQLTAYPTLTSLLRKHDVTFRSILHVGAHYGKELHSYLDSGISKLTFIEGDPEVFEVLKKNILKEPKASALNMYLAEFDDEREIYIASNNGASSSLLPPAKHKMLRPEISFEEPKKVLTKSLDGIGLENHDVLVLDVQGAEIEVLRGGQNFLNGCKALWIEVSEGGLYQGDSKVEEIIDFLGPDFFPVYLNMNIEKWGDALFLRRTNKTT